MAMVAVLFAATLIPAALSTGAAEASTANQAELREAGITIDQPAKRGGKRGGDRVDKGDRDGDSSDIRGRRGRFD